MQKPQSKFFLQKKPIVYVGGGGFQSDASEELKAMATLLRVPVTKTLWAWVRFQVLISNVGYAWYAWHLSGEMAMHETDLIVAVGHALMIG
ncbi:MAG: hypothetical protein Ct9H90mP27_5820 [Gammaproteobacteria bacterium]|nr:MAG: hypothetical protein Ct9H90mP27_5820 [Gammaproteobacteria bacterium]